MFKVFSIALKYGGRMISSAGKFAGRLMGRGGAKVAAEAGAEAATVSARLGKGTVSRLARAVAGKAARSMGRMPTLVKRLSKIALEVGVFMGIDHLLHKVINDDGEGVLSPEEQAYVEHVKALGLSTLSAALVNSRTQGGYHQIEDFGNISQCMTRCLTDRRLIFDGSLNAETEFSVNTLSPRAQAFAIARLIAAAKAIAGASKAPGVLTLYLHQVALSDTLVSGPTRNFAKLVVTDAIYDQEINTAAADLSSTLSALADELKMAAGDDFFNDVKSSNPFNDNASAMSLSSASLEHDIALKLSGLAVDETAFSPQGWYDRLTTDMDDNDDEATAVRHINNDLAFDNNYLRAMIQLADQRSGDFQSTIYS